MNIFINLKSLGKRKKTLEKIEYSIPNGIETLRGLISAIVSLETESYNARGSENMLVNFLTEEQIEDKSSVGKVDFGRLYSENKADTEKSINVAILGFEDGLFRVLINETEATELDTPLIIKNSDVVTFIRLTFLAGRLW